MTCVESLVTVRRNSSCSPSLCVPVRGRDRPRLFVVEVVVPSSVLSLAVEMIVGSVVEGEAVGCAVVLVFGVVGGLRIGLVMRLEVRLRRRC